MMSNSFFWKTMLSFKTILISDLVDSSAYIHVIHIWLHDWSVQIR